MSTRSRPRDPYAVAAAGCVALVVAAYANFFANDLQFDDQSVVVNNVYIRSLANVPRFFADARTFSSFPANMTYRPLVSTSLALDHAIGRGLSPVAFHASQLLLMLALGALLVAFFRQVMDDASPGPGNRWLSLLAATLFCVHVVNTETMNLMHVRSELLSTIGIVAAFVVYGSGRDRPRRWLSIVPMAIGAFAKIPSVLFAPLLFTWEYLRGGERARPRTRDRLRAAVRAAAPATVAACALYAFIERVMRAPAQTYGGSDPYRYALTQAWAWTHYLRLFFLPFGLSADTDLRLIARWYDVRVIVGVLVIGLLVAITWWTARRREHRPVSFGLAWYMISLLPASSVLPLAEPINEHRPFVAYIGLALAVVWGARLALEAAPARWRTADPARTTGLALCAVLLAHAAGVHVRNRVWRTDETLWADVTAKSPGNGRAWMNYGVALMARAKWEPARAALDRAAHLAPAYHVVHVNLGVLAGATGDDASAERHFRRALALAPWAPDTYDFYARWLVRKGRTAEAIPLLETALRLAPGDDMARTTLRKLRGSPAGAGRGEAAAAR